MGLRPTNTHESLPGLSFRAKRGICFLSSSRKSRFLVAKLLGMTERWDDLRRSAARNLLFGCSKQAALCNLRIPPSHAWHFSATGRGTHGLLSICSQILPLNCCVVLCP